MTISKPKVLQLAVVAIIFLMLQEAVAMYPRLGFEIHPRPLYEKVKRKSLRNRTKKYFLQ